MADSAPNQPLMNMAENVSSTTAAIESDPALGQFIDSLNGGEPVVPPVTEENLTEFGWDERPQSYGDEFGDQPPAPESSSVESAEATVSSPGSGPAPSQAPAPQLDPTQQMLAAMMQQMQAQQQQFAETLKQFAPKPPEPPPADPFADLPPEFDTPEIRKFIEYSDKRTGKVSQELAAFKQELEQRIQQATQERQVKQMYNEAASLGKAFAQELGATGKDAQDLADWFHDQTVIYANKYGGTPAQYDKPVRDIFNKGVALQQAKLNSKAKAAVAQRHPGVAARPQAPGSAMSPNQNRTPTLADARAAGYKSLFDAALDGDAKIHQLWARQGAQGK